MYYFNIFVCCANLAFIFVLADYPEEGSVSFPKTIKTNNLYPPMSMIRRINAITDEEDFIREFVVGGDSGLTIRFGPVSKQPTPKAARCQPELRTINLQNGNSDPTLTYFPSCTRVERCGGCCTHGSLSCQATEKENKNFTVNVYKYTGNQNFERVEEKSVTVEIHKKCNCNCITQAKDCSSVQVYDKDECRCKCLNKEAERKCSHVKLWNPSLCSCECRDIPQCSTGQEINQTSCSCANIPKSRNVHEINYNRYNPYPN